MNDRLALRWRLAGLLIAVLIIVALPYAVTRNSSAQAALARTFAGELEALLDIPVDTYDERLTSRMADASRRNGSKASRDSLAAAHLLEAYLASLARDGGES